MIEQVEIVLAVIWDVLLSQYYLDGHKFTIDTNHEALKWILSLSDGTGKLVCSPLRLSEFEFDFGHRSGTKKQAADILSRFKTCDTDTTESEDDLPEVILPIIKHRGENTSDNHDTNSDF